MRKYRRYLEGTESVFGVAVKVTLRRVKGELYGPTDYVSIDAHHNSGVGRSK